MNSNYVINLLKGWGVNLPLDIEEKFAIYTETLLEWNKKMNLTRITKCEEIYIEHFLDSIMPFKFFTLNKHDKVFDIGAGAGFPGIPIKLVNKEIDLTALDSQNKKVNFLKKLVHNLKLEGVELLHDRAENMGRNSEYRGTYTYVFTRAVASLNIIAELGLPLLNEGGCLVAWKTKKQFKKEKEEAQNALDILGGQFGQCYSYKLPNKDDEHLLVVIKKVCKTPDKYPRRPGIPEKRPL
ncbi:16S rRNA (guanine(527)-N(7))-methyltransferase RsmG [Natranaerobius trueperi]|uniref:Ribosomal RNA small subunit methyltransferase G n=1 Tax=Natranaerobius trueperi TaxID=759412 RepID=A0A226BZ49_9FIRM|nr:16S rRNA (guanine(527)-N(7))-methyltransferase RsmG [Natranaerobius trueperi]OWZ83479.1 16S rRNA (guanine(527)-N(7))-methyltransferase RsmG [Natranaerobius trueperi]